jgi:hypothetical protein
VRDAVAPILMGSAAWSRGGVVWGGHAAERDRGRAWRGAQAALSVSSGPAAARVWVARGRHRSRGGGVCQVAARHSPGRRGSKTV